VAKSRTILLVEDNPDDVELTLRAFERTQILCDIVVVRDGQEALDYLLSTGPYATRPPEPPHVVLLDIKLPRVDGLAVLERVRADPRTRLVPIVLLTSSLEDRDVAMAYELGANSYVRKPVNFSEFLEVARRLGEYWLLVNAPPRRDLTGSDR
jgi:two-component system response regulator